MRLPYDAAGQQWHTPTALRAAYFDAVQEDLGPPAVAVSLDAKVVNLGLHFLDQCDSVMIDLLALLGRTAHDVERTPREHARDGVQIRSVDVAAQARRLEGDLARAAEGVGHLGAMTEAHHSELLDQLREGVRIRAKVRVHLPPDVVVDGGDFLGPATLGDAFAVGHGGQQFRLEPPPLPFRQIGPPSHLDLLVGGIRPVYRRRLR